MSEAERPATTLHVLVRHATDPSLLVRSAGDGPPRLPVVEGNVTLDELAAIEALVAGVIGDGAVLRIAPSYPTGRERAPDVVVETEPPLGNRPPPGCAWLPLAEAEPASLGPPAIEARLERWLAEQRAGVPAARRPRWSRPGFRDRARTWMTARLAEAGTPVRGQPRVTYLWGLSAIMRAETAEGATFLKSCARVFPTEPSITAAVARVAPDLAPAVVAADDTEGWLLMRDVGGRPIGDGPVEERPDGLVALGDLQRRWRTSPEAIELERRGPAELAASLPGLVDDPVLAGLADADRARLREALPRLLATCRRIAELGPAPTIVHGDFHPWNVHRTGDRVSIIDWSDACLGHPFFDLTTYVGRSRDVAVRRTIVARCLAGWAGEASMADLEEAATLALPLGALHQVESYRRILASLEPDDAWDLGGAGHHFAVAAVDWLEDGLEARIRDHEPSETPPEAGA